MHSSPGLGRRDLQQLRRQAVHALGDPLGLLRTQRPDRRHRPLDGLKLPLKLAYGVLNRHDLKVALAGDVIAPHAWEFWKADICASSAHCTSHIRGAEILVPSEKQVPVRRSRSWQTAHVAGSRPLIAFIGGGRLISMFDYDAWREMVMPGAIANGWTPAPPGDSWHCVLERWVRGDDTGEPIWIVPTGPLWDETTKECTVTGTNWGPDTQYPNIRAAKAAVHERFPINTELAAHWSSSGHGQWICDDGKVGIVQVGEPWESFPFRLFNQSPMSRGAKLDTLAQAIKTADECLPCDSVS